MKNLNIAFLPGLKRPIAPDTTISRNRIIVDLATDLVKRGHQVTIFGTKDSFLPGVSFHPVIPKGLSSLPPTENPFYTETAYITHAISELIRNQHQFDLIHNHMYPEFLPLLAACDMTVSMVTTVHAQITTELSLALLDTVKHTTLVCISESAKKKLNLPAAVVYNGIDTNLFSMDESTKKPYFLFVGRMSKAKSKGRFLDPKGACKAIYIAQKAQVTLKIVGNVEDRAFYDTLIAPHLSKTIEFVGEVSSEQKISRKEMVRLYQNARALLFPINWEEPFGLVMIEAMACGTPVIAFNRGSVSEIVQDGLTGFVVDPNKGVDGFVEVISRISSIDRKTCRQHVLAHFSKEKMGEEYEKIYRKSIQEKQV